MTDLTANIRKAVELGGGHVERTLRLLDLALRPLHDELDQAKRTSGGLMAKVQQLGGQLKTAEARVASVRAFADDMATWCSPHGIASDYAQRLLDVLDGPSPVN